MLNWRHDGQLSSCSIATMVSQLSSSQRHVERSRHLQQDAVVNTIRQHAHATKQTQASMSCPFFFHSLALPEATVHMHHTPHRPRAGALNCTVHCTEQMNCEAFSILPPRGPWTLTTELALHIFFSILHPQFGCSRPVLTANATRKAVNKTNTLWYTVKASRIENEALMLSSHLAQDTAF